MKSRIHQQHLTGVDGGLEAVVQQQQDQQHLPHDESKEALDETEVCVDKQVLRGSSDLWMRSILQDLNNVTSCGSPY